MTEDGKRFIQYVNSQSHITELADFTRCIRDCLNCPHFKYKEVSSYWRRAKCCYRSKQGFSLYHTCHYIAEREGRPNECPLRDIEERVQLTEDYKLVQLYSRITNLQNRVAREEKLIDKLWKEVHTIESQLSGSNNDDDRSRI